MSGEWIPVRTADGSWTLSSPAVGESCHSRAGAWQQACLRYAEGADLAGLGARLGPRRPARLLDVGTGLGLNLAAALRALAPSGTALEATSLEHSREVLEAGCALYEREARPDAPWEPWHASVRAALAVALGAVAFGAAKASCASAGEGPARVSSVPLGRHGHLELRLGDARRALGPADEGRYDALFLDPFSPGRAPELWDEAFLGHLARCLAPGGILVTYCAAFAVRRGLRRAGLRVGRGARVGHKAEGTLASPDRALPPLAPRLARRLERQAFLGVPGGDRGPSFD